MYLTKAKTAANPLIAISDTRISSPAYFLPHPPISNNHPPSPSRQTHTSPGKPGGMTTSRSSSYTSHLDDASVLSDPSHFEDISLDDVTIAARRAAPAARDANLRLAIPKPQAQPYAPDGLAARSVSSRTLTRQRDVSQKFLPQRDPTSRSRPSSPLPPNSRSASPNGSYYEPPRSAGPLHRPPIRSSTSSLYPESLRSPSSSNLLGLKPSNQHLPQPRRRRSWQSNRDRKPVEDIDIDDDDDDDDIPDGLILDNVPISPRPSRDRPTSQPPSPLLAPLHPPAPPQNRRSVGNGTPPVATAQGSLRSPTWKSDTALSDAASAEFPPPAKGRAKSWNIAMAGLSPEMKALTTKLEEHSDEVDEEANKRPATWNAGQVYDPTAWDPSLKKKSHSHLNLPPLRTNLMLDPLPISKEKEAVLSRTRPSWLPPKDPAEERRHLRQYQKMMASSLEAERRRDAEKNDRTSRRDVKADSLMRTWEDEILPRWTDAVREPRTRELWWRGVAPRSRGAVWSRAVGNNLGLTEQSYTAALKRAHEAEARIKEDKGDAEDTRRAEWFAAIRRDVCERTWPDLRIFQEGGPLNQSLVDVLYAYAMYRGDIGYVPGSNVSGQPSFLSS